MGLRRVPGWKRALRRAAERLLGCRYVGGLYAPRGWTSQQIVDAAAAGVGVVDPPFIAAGGSAHGLYYPASWTSEELASACAKVLREREESEGG